METRTMEVRVRFDDTDERTDATVTATIGGREFSGWGRARRNPADPPAPLVGEELALARAMADLSDHLLDVASGAIAAREGHEVLLRR
jgi:hypothetical protein